MRIFLTYSVKYFELLHFLAIFPNMNKESGNIQEYSRKIEENFYIHLYKKTIVKYYSHISEFNKQLISNKLDE